MHFIMCPPHRFSEPPQPLASLPVDGGCTVPGTASGPGPCFLAMLQRTKSHHPFLGLAWSLLSLPLAKGEAESGPGGFCLILSLTQKNRWIKKSLYSGWFVFVYLGVSYDLCFYDSFGIEGCWWVWFTPPPPGILQENASVTWWWQAEGRDVTDGSRVGLQCRYWPISHKCSEVS